MHNLLLGGSFDPLHLGHLEVARAGLQIAEKVWLVPCGQHPFDKRISTSSHRLAMVKLQTEFPILESEIAKAEPSYSFQTLQSFSSAHPDERVSWLIGSDQVDSFNRWHSYQALLKEFGVYVYPRKGSADVSLYPGMQWLPNVRPIDISSTDIKDRVRKKQSIAELVPEAVERYIAQYQLYL